MLRIADQAYRTDTGRQRRANEDSYYVRAPVFVVADGMGGAQAGEVASRIAAEEFDRDLPSDPPEEILREAFESANRKIHDHAATDESHAGMGTTLTAVIVDAERDEVAIGHVGDSRAYRLRDGKLERLTQDHSLVEELRRKGQLTDEQAEEHPQRSIITRALGPEAEVEPDVGTVHGAARRRLPSLLRRPHDDDRRKSRSRRSSAPRPASTRRCGPWSPRPTGPGGETTSLPSPFDSSRLANRPPKSNTRLWSAPRPRRRGCVARRCAEPRPPRHERGPRRREGGGR